MIGEDRSNMKEEIALKSLRTLACFRSVKEDIWYLGIIVDVPRHMTEQINFLLPHWKDGGHVTYGDNSKGKTIGECDLDTHSTKFIMLLVESQT